MEAYDAFISYSHAADGQLAPALQSTVQRYAKPWYRRRALRVFRDDTGLSANPHLWTSIVEALDGSRWFILLSSPDAARSEWVGREIAHWVKAKDLVVQGVNVCEELRKVENPVLCIAANGDGIVPPETAAFPYHQVASKRKQLLEVGTRTIAMAHADLFVSKEAHERVFRPLAQWLSEPGASSPAPATV